MGNGCCTMLQFHGIKPPGGRAITKLLRRFQMACSVRGHFVLALTVWPHEVLGAFLHAGSVIGYCRPGRRLQHRQEVVQRECGPY